jgi:hypothetical protein
MQKSSKRYYATSRRRINEQFDDIDESVEHMRRKKARREQVFGYLDQNCYVPNEKKPKPKRAYDYDYSTEYDFENQVHNEKDRIRHEPSSPLSTSSLTTSNNGRKTTVTSGEGEDKNHNLHHHHHHHHLDDVDGDGYLGSESCDMEFVESAKKKIVSLTRTMRFFIRHDSVIKPGEYSVLEKINLEEDERVKGSVDDSVLVLIQNHRYDPILSEKFNASGNNRAITSASSSRRRITKFIDGEKTIINPSAEITTTVKVKKNVFCSGGMACKFADYCLGVSPPGSVIAEMKPRKDLFGFFNVGPSVLCKIHKNSRKEGDGCVIWIPKKTKIMVENVFVHVQELVFGMCCSDVGKGQTVDQTCSKKKTCIHPKHLRKIVFRNKIVGSSDIVTKSTNINNKNKNKNNNNNNNKDDGNNNLEDITNAKNNRKDLWKEQMCYRLHYTNSNTDIQTNKQINK